MKSMHKFFHEQMAETACPYAIKRLSRKILPKLCIENDICPGCGGDLEETHDPRGAYIRSPKRTCTQCKVEFSGIPKGVVHDRPDTKPAPFIQQRSADSRA